MNLPLHSLTLLALVASPRALGIQAPQTDEPAAHTAAAFAPLRDRLTEPLFDVAADGALWARTRDLRLAFVDSALTVYPVLGKAAPRELPTRFELAAATLGGTPLPLTRSGAVTRDGATVRVERGALTEVHHVRLAGVEQTFVLAELPPCDGDLVLDVVVESQLHAAADGDTLVFQHESYGALDYGPAFVFDAAGLRAPIERRWTGRSIELTVPASFLAAATLPLTVDPVIQWFSSGFGVADDARPDIVFCGQTDEYLACWEEFTSAANSDVYVTKWDEAFSAQGPAIAIELGNDTWIEPRIAYSYMADRALVVATVNPVPMGLPVCTVSGRFVDVAAFATPAPAFLISSIGATKHGADVGGSNRLSTAEDNFCVVYSQEGAGNQHDVRYRVVAPDGTFLTGNVVVDGGPEDDVTPSIARHLGGGVAPDLAWTLVWVRDTDQDGVGRVLARRIAYDGDPAATVGNFTVDGFGNTARPVVSARLEVPLLGQADLPSVVAFERVLPSTLFPGTLQGDIELRVVTDGLPHLQSSLTAMEDFDAALDQRGPAIATNGRGFIVGYLEESWSSPGTGDFDVCLATGNVAEVAGFGIGVLAERHMRVGFTTLVEGPVRLTAEREGDPFRLSGEGAAVWARQGPTSTTGFGGVHGVTFEHLAATLAGPRAVGLQSCDAVPNSVGLFGGRNASWLRILGNQSAGSLHTAQCVGLPANSFGYLNVAPALGDVLHPGGSQGRLCLSGPIGRYVGAVQSSGGSGVIQVTIDPAALPQPSGSVAAVPGQTWHFQLWHRDAVGGVATSNFSNACSVHFRN